VIAHLLGDPRRKCAQQIIRDQGPPLGGHPCVGTQGIKRGQSPLSDPRTIDGQQLSDFVVSAPAPEHELQNGALITWKGIDRGHGST
jgi:hypothetical protein